MQYLLQEREEVDVAVAFRRPTRYQPNLTLVKERPTAIAPSQAPVEVAHSSSSYLAPSAPESSEQGSQFDHYWLSSNSMVPIRAIDPQCYEFLQDQPLTRRELEILRLIVQGNSNAEIARKLYVSNGTVKTHLRKLFAKLAVRDRTQAAVFALRSGLVN